MSPPPVLHVSIEPSVIVAAGAMIACFALALWWRSWTWWLAGYVTSLITLVLLWRGR